MQTLLDILRDPVWQFVTVLLAIPPFVISIFQLKLLIARAKKKRTRSVFVAPERRRSFPEVVREAESDYPLPDRRKRMQTGELYRVTPEAHNGYVVRGRKRPVPVYATYENEAFPIKEKPDHNSVWLMRMSVSFLATAVIFSVLIVTGIVQRPYPAAALSVNSGGQVYSIQAGGTYVNTWQSNAPIPMCNNHLTPTPSATASPVLKATPTPACSIHGNVTPTPIVKP